MQGIAGGLLAALLWGVSVMFSSRSTKLVGGPTAAGLVHLIGIAIIAVLCAATSPGHGITARHVAWAIAAGVGTVLGSTLLILAVRHGKISVVTPIVSASGGLAALGAFALGEHVAGTTAALLALTAAGVVGVAAGGSAAVERSPRRAGAGALALAGGSCLGYAVSGLATGKAASAISIAWVIMPSRVLGVAALSLPLLARGRLRVPRSVLPLVAGTAVLDVGGFLCLAWGLHDGIAVPNVLASLFAAVATAGGFVAFRERLTRGQALGIAVILVGVAGLAAVSA